MTIQPAHQGSEMEDIDCYRALVFAAAVAAVKDAINGDYHARYWLRTTGARWLSVFGMELESDDIDKTLAKLGPMSKQALARQFPARIPPLDAPKILSNQQRPWWKA